MFVHQNTWVMVLELALKTLIFFYFKSELEKLFVKGLSMRLGNTWELVLE